MSSKIDVLPGLHRTEDVMGGRPSPPESSPLSSPTTLPKSPDSLDSLALSEAIADCDEENASSQNATLQPSSPVYITSATVPSSFASNPNDLSDANTNHSSIIKSAPIRGDASNSNTIRERRELRNRRFPRPAQRPHSLNLSEPESFIATQDSLPYSSRDTGQSRVKRRVTQRSPSISSSTPSTGLNDIFSERQAGSDLSWSPEYPDYTIAAQPPPNFPPNFDPRFVGPQVFPQQYPIHQYVSQGTPRGPAPFPFFQVPQPPTTMSAAPPVSPPPLNQPLAGYDLLAAKIAGDIGGAVVKPIYRRFDSMHHRILLSLQDQIIEMEEAIADMGRVEAENWGGVPAAERASRASDHPFHVNKGLSIGLASQKLQYYYTLLASHRDIQGFARPTAEDIRAYRQFLATDRPIVGEESRFLDAVDLVVLENKQTLGQRDSNRPATAPRPTNDVNGQNSTSEQRSILNRGPFQDYAIGMVLAIFLPLITFHVVRDFGERMAIVILAGVVVYIYLLRSGINIVANAQNYQEGFGYAAVYIGAMATLSWLL